MTSLTNSEGKILNYTNEFIETILLQLNSSNNYYTTGDDDVIFIKIGSTKVLLLDYTFHINRNIFQNYSINENTINDYGLEFILKNTSNEYTLQGVYTANSFIGTITALQQVFLAIYDTSISPSTYTGSENIDITDNQISLNFPLKINDEIVMHPRNYDGAVFQMNSGTDNFTFLQNTIHGGAPIAQFYSSTKTCTFHGDVEIPNMYSKSSMDLLISAIYNDTYAKTDNIFEVQKIRAMSANFPIIADAVFFYDGIMESLFEFRAPNIYNKTEIDTFLTNTNLAGSENLDITNNEISLTFPLKVNGEIVMNPRAYGIQFELYAATSGFAFLQNQQDGAQPIAIFNSLDKSVEFFGDLDIPNFYNKTEIDAIAFNGDLANYYNKTQVDAIVANINFSNNHYTKTEVDDIDNELSALILNTYTKTEVDTQLTDYATISYLQGNYMTSLAITETLMNNYANITFIVDNFYDKTYLDNQFTLKVDVSELANLVTTEYINTKYTNTVDLTSIYYNKTETDNLLNQKVNTSGGGIQGDLSAYVFRCGEIKINNDDDLNSLSMKQLTPHDSIFDLRTEESSAKMHFNIKGENFMSLSTADNISMYKDTNIYGVLTTGNTTINGVLNTGHTTINGDTIVTGRLDVGVSPDFSTNWINIYSDNTSGNGFSAVMQFTTWGGKNGTWDISSNTTDVKIEFKLDGNLFMKFFNNNNEIRYYKTLVNSSDDRLKENEVIIENACETLSKLRPQLYDKKPDIKNDDPTTWHKESGLIAQEIYYDAPELRHLVSRGESDTPLPEIPTSIDPQQDPDYSSWGEETAAVNYIGLIAYLVKANNELHERVKLLESK